MARRRLWTAPERSYGELVATELREKGIPVFTMSPQTGLEWYNPTHVEVWIEDDSLLDDYETQNAIRETIESIPLSEKDAEEIEEMPFEDVPEKPLVNVSKDTMPIVVVGVILVVALLVYLIWSNSVSERGPF